MEIRGFKTTWTFPRVRGTIEEGCVQGLAKYDHERCHKCLELFSTMVIKPKYNSKGLLAGIYMVCMPCRCKQYLPINLVEERLI